MFVVTLLLGGIVDSESFSDVDYCDTCYRGVVGLSVCHTRALC